MVSGTCRLSPKKVLPRVIQMGSMGAQDETDQKHTPKRGAILVKKLTCPPLSKTVPPSSNLLRNFSGHGKHSYGRARVDNFLTEGLGCAA